MKLFLSCEHGGNEIPAHYRHLFTQAEAVLETHRGFDRGALALYQALEATGVHFALASQTTRLLVDLNRSLFRRSLFSEYTKILNIHEKEKVLNDHYYPFRNAFFNEAKRVVAGGDTLFHVSVHAFTPVLNGIERRADIGLLYNPAHGSEKAVAKSWKQALQTVFPDFIIRFNYPYLGKTDGHVAPLRKAFGNRYSGIELELNSKHAGNLAVINGIVLTYQKLIHDEFSLGTP
jgi:predicted N-formylglutamate amidohydrolase